MSTPALGWTMDHSPLSGTALVVHMMIADLVNDEHGNALFAAQEWIADRARTTRGTVGRVIADMVTAGLLVPLPSTPYAPNNYRFVMDSDRYPKRIPKRPKTAMSRARRPGPAIPPMPPPPSVVRDSDAPQTDLSCIKSAPVSCIKSAHITKDLELQVEAKSLATDKPSPKGARGKAPTFTPTADKLARAEWDRREIKPVQKFIVIRQLVDDVLAAGHSEADVERVMPQMAVFSRNAFDFALNGKVRRNGLRSVPLPISADRDAPEGLVET